MTIPGQEICPTCKLELSPALQEFGPLTERWPNFPFCSDRCRLIDLGKWFQGEYRFPGTLLDPENLPEPDAK